VIHIIGTGQAPTPFDDKYVAAYDPSYHPAGEEYDGGLLLVVDRPEEAQQFQTLADALAKYRASYGIRTDGEPNRPLTAFTVEFFTVRTEALTEGKVKR